MDAQSRQHLAWARRATPAQLNAVAAQLAARGFPNFIRDMQALHRQDWYEHASDGNRIAAAVAKYGEARVRETFQRNGVADLIPVAEQSYVRHVQAHPDNAPAPAVQTSPPRPPAPPAAAGKPAGPVQLRPRQAVQKRSLDELWRAFDRLSDKDWERAGRDPKHRDLVEHRNRLEKHSEILRFLKDEGFQQSCANWLNRPQARAFLQAYPQLRDHVRGSHTPGEVVVKLLRVATSEDMLAEGRLDGNRVLRRDEPGALSRGDIVKELAHVFGTKVSVVRKAVETLDGMEMRDTLLVRGTSEEIAQSKVIRSAPTPERRAKEHLSRLIDKDPRFKETAGKVRVSTRARYAAEKAYQKHSGEKQELELDRRVRRELEERGELEVEGSAGQEPAAPSGRPATEAAYEAVNTEGTDDARE